MKSDPPLVLLMVDGSTSMYDAQVWAPTFEAVTATDGPIARYEGRVRFGFASYRGDVRTAEDDPACTEFTSVPFGLSNSSSIREAYASLPGDRSGWPWETPTGHAVTRVTQDFLAEPAGVKKYILLVSDGAPDTCRTRSCGQDRSIFAVQSAFRAGVQTRAIGIGFGNVYPGCSPETARCASDHFQDLANAGRGLPVIAPPAGYVSLPCAAETGGQLLAEYSDVGGTAPFFWTSGPTDVANAVDGVLAEVVAR
jgi:hypothetical protein